MFKVETDKRNKYIDAGMSIQKAYDICGEWEDKERRPYTAEWGIHRLVSDHVLLGGTKGRWGDLLFQRWKEEGVTEFVYVAPRQGYAGIAMAHLARRHGVNLTLFMPASKAASDHQLLAIELGAKPIFHRIAAMPNLNRIAKAYAEQKDGARFIPFGLDHELVVAAGIKSTIEFCNDPVYEFGVDAVATVVSTGVLTRTLQIAWPHVDWYGVAVARNMHDGECGQAFMTSYHKPFTSPADSVRWMAKLGLPSDFVSERCYDLKGVEYTSVEQDPTLFWNVAGDAPKPTLTAAEVDSQRDW